MAETSMSSGGQHTPDIGGPAPKIYSAGGARKTFFAFVFLILLPFFVSLPVMLYQRIAHGVWLQTWGLIIIAVAFTAIMLLVVFELLNSILSRIYVGQTGVRFRLPPRNGLMPTIFYRRREIPYANIAAIETRREVYGGALAPVMMRGARIIDKEGKAYSLGYVSEADVDPVFPIADIAAEIARRAGVPITDKGTVRRHVRRKILGFKHDDGAGGEIPESEIATLNRKHFRFMMVLISLMTVLLLVGVAADFMTSSSERGERATDSVVRSPTVPARR